MGDPGQAMRDPHFWVRFTEMVFAIIAFSVIAEGAGYSRWAWWWQTLLQTGAWHLPRC